MNDLMALRNVLVDMTVENKYPGVKRKCTEKIEEHLGVFFDQDEVSSNVILRKLVDESEIDQKYLDAYEQCMNILEQIPFGMLKESYLVGVSTYTIKTMDQIAMHFILQEMLGNL